jgi:hypothetical protein
MRSTAVFAAFLFSVCTEITVAQAHLGLGRVSSVVPVDGGCVFQDSLPTNAVESWDVEEARTYAITLTNVTDCANGGTDPILEVMVRSSNTGNVCVTATQTATGVYTFTVMLPPNACNTYPIHYCTACAANQGLVARRADGGNKASHLRAATFAVNCGAPISDIDCTSGCAAYVTDLGGGCGAPTPSLHSTMPLAGYDNLIAIKGAPPGAPLYFAANGQPYPSSNPLGGGCILHVDPATATIIGPFTASVIGDYYLSLSLPPSMPVFAVRIQAAAVLPGAPGPTVLLTNAIESKFGSCSPFCTHMPGSFTGSGPGSAVFDIEYPLVFPSGIEIGVFDPSNGGASPNGLRWTGDAAGQAALEAFLADAGGPSGPFVSDGLNPTGPNGGGSLAIQAAALTLNIGFNAAGVLAGAQNNLGSLVYLKMDVDEPLSGLSLVQILDVANQALAGNGLPDDVTFESLASFIEFVNSSFVNCTMGWPASHRLYNADFE